MRAAPTLLLVAALAAGALWWLGSQGDAPPADDTLLAFDDDEPAPKEVGTPETPRTVPTAATPSERGMPRILPPDAAIEDIRDALALKDAAAREASLRAAYGSIGRIAQAPRILVGLQRHAVTVEDARVRGATYAALGANTSGPSHAWLARKLADGPALEDRIGALLGLAYDANGSERTAAALGGLPHKSDALPKRVDVREALPRVLASLEGDALLDVLPVLEASLEAHDGWFATLAPEVTALRAKAERTKAGG